MRGCTGRYKVTRFGNEEVRAFAPNPLPPVPPVELGQDLELYKRANLALGRLDALGLLLPDLPLFIYHYVRKEAVLSSQIEGTQSSVADLLMFENEQAPGVPEEDVEEVSNYVGALFHGVERMRHSLPLSLRLLREMHARLLQRGRGSEKQPGEFRTSQNWIGGTMPRNAIYVPPPPEEMLECLDALERFIHAEQPGVPPLIRAGMAHVQFESIHSFLDGNARLGRQLITLMLCSQGVIHEPILYLSLFFKQNRDRYYGLLQAVRVDGDWEGWLAFYLEGIASTAENAYSKARRLVALFEADRKRLETHRRSSSTLLRMHELLRQRPIWQAPKLAKAMDLTGPGVSKQIATMIEEEVLCEISGKERYQVYCYQRYLDILNEGTEPLKRAA
ncbi:MAG: Fic family protein [Acidobacteria bacterium]|nr:Fic family protein [Acidobacteriota bacterium]